MKVKLTKISRPEGLEGGLRTPEIIGDCEHLPAVGYCFEMTAKPLSGIPNAVRVVNTSKVVEITSAFTENKNILYTLKTWSGSVYTVEVIGESEQNPLLIDPVLMIITR